MSAKASQTIGVSVGNSTVCSGVDQRKHQISASLAFVRGMWPMTLSSLLSVAHGYWKSQHCPYMQRSWYMYMPNHESLLRMSEQRFSSLMRRLSCIAKNLSKRWRIDPLFALVIRVNRSSVDKQELNKLLQQLGTEIPRGSKEQNIIWVFDNDLRHHNRWVE